MKSVKAAENTKRNKVGRPRIPDSQKVIYQRLPIKYETYKKLREVRDITDMTFTELVESMLKVYTNLPR